MDYRNGLLYEALSACNAFYIHRMTEWPTEATESTSSMHFRNPKKLNFQLWWLEVRCVCVCAGVGVGGWGTGSKVSKIQDRWII